MTSLAVVDGEVSGESHRSAAGEIWGAMGGAAPVISIKRLIQEESDLDRPVDPTCQRHLRLKLYRSIYHLKL